MKMKLRKIKNGLDSTGRELYDKTIGFLVQVILAKVITRALAFGMKVIAFDKYPDKKFASRYNVKYYSSPIELIKKAISYHLISL